MNEEPRERKKPEESSEAPAEDRPEPAGVLTPATQAETIPPKPEVSPAGPASLGPPTGPAPPAPAGLKATPLATAKELLARAQAISKGRAAPMPGGLLSPLGPGGLSGLGPGAPKVDKYFGSKLPPVCRQLGCYVTDDGKFYYCINPHCHKDRKRETKYNRKRRSIVYFFCPKCKSREIQLHLKKNQYECLECAYAWRH